MPERMLELLIDEPDEDVVGPVKDNK